MISFLEQMLQPQAIHSRMVIPVHNLYIYIYMAENKCNAASLGTISDDTVTVDGSDGMNRNIWYAVLLATTSKYITDIGAGRS